MSLAGEIQALSGTFHERLAFAQNLLDHPEESRNDTDLLHAMLQALPSEKTPHAVQTALVFLLSKLNIKQAIPILVELLKEDFAFQGDSPGYLNFDAVNGLLEFGEDAVPALENLLLATKSAEMALLVTTMLFNITRDKVRVRKSLQKMDGAWMEEEKSPYEFVLRELDKM